MSSIELVDIIQVKKEPYEYKIMRRCDQNLPLITNAEGQSYYDNRIILRLSYQHQVRYERVFTKQDFAQLVNARFLKHARFEGMAFDCVTDAGWWWQPWWHHLSRRLMNYLGLPEIPNHSSIARCCDCLHP